MQIITERLILRDYSLNDLTNLMLLKSNSLVWRFSDKSVVSNIFEVKGMLDAVLNKYKEDQCDVRALYLKDPSTYIGEAGILSINKRCNRCIIGYNLLPQYWGYGYATEITRGLIQYIFEDLGIERIEALTLEKNIASRSVLMKSGFTEEGLLRNFSYINQQYNNVCYYGMIKQDYTDMNTR